MDYLKQIFEKLFCSHKWEKLNEFRVYSINKYGKRSGNPSAYRILYTCSKCGKHWVYTS